MGLRNLTRGDLELYEALNDPGMMEHLGGPRPLRKDGREAQYQGRGIGSASVREALDRARSTGRWDVLHAFPPVANPRSNAMCHTLGFEMLEEADFEFRRRRLRCNHWRLDLRLPATG